MRHFVHGPDGTKYGPADLELLKEWRADGRIAADTLLEPEVGGAAFPAKDLQELFPEEQERPSYGQADWGYVQYPTQDQSPAPGPQSQSYATATWILGGCSVLVCPLLLAPAALICAIQAKSKGHPQGTVLILYAVV